uniref:Transmembrane protein n=1 Tax=Chromera velia CCMP2878 TaxID=1169474 RepID=A0A0G4HFS2_9ALVE|mmetsp:Transcript_33066/g.65578  ORF Transcript_33066/g.65578 Transcript_33066/m.65578 type:complete len:470 (+) Transcript_33066:237-1646(+)|eukprot:Cvel_992.t1-p1 / transcript=Cvel_992.t1 / gene=Cvel_992 / organism=Chromera_velia_CCMP2878 / gene_product=hypothetical protein / transcript_product=hypothetical protein / location=Cvel_scaffold32:78942-80348(-) / protein_length=469 / sequence_SO=supercontig / SO=protein_coding / is_pseudo=false
MCSGTRKQVRKANVVPHQGDGDGDRMNERLQGESLTCVHTGDDGEQRHLRAEQKEAGMFGMDRDDLGHLVGLLLASLSVSVYLCVFALAYLLGSSDLSVPEKMHASFVCLILTVSPLLWLWRVSQQRMWGPKLLGGLMGFGMEEAELDSSSAEVQSGLQALREEGACAVEVEVSRETTPSEEENRAREREGREESEGEGKEKKTFHEYCEGERQPHEREEGQEEEEQQKESVGSKREKMAVEEMKGGAVKGKQTHREKEQEEIEGRREGGVERSEGQEEAKREENGSRDDAEERERRKASQNTEVTCTFDAHPRDNTQKIRRLEKSQIDFLWEKLAASGSFSSSSSSSARLLWDLNDLNCPNCSRSFALVPVPLRIPLHQSSSSSSSFSSSCSTASAPESERLPQIVPSEEPERNSEGDRLPADLSSEERHPPRHCQEKKGKDGMKTQSRIPLVLECKFCERVTVQPLN